jgi:hypothetical protein
MRAGGCANIKAVFHFLSHSTKNIKIDSNSFPHFTVSNVEYMKTVNTNTVDNLLHIPSEI